MPANWENDVVYTNVIAKKRITDKRLLQGRMHFYKAWWYQLLYQDLHNISRFRTSMSINIIYYYYYYCEMSLKGLSPDIHHSDVIFQQDGAPAHCCRHVTKLLNLHFHDVPWSSSTWKTVHLLQTSVELFLDVGNFAAEVFITLGPVGCA